MKDNDYLSTKQAALVVGLSPKTLARYRVTGAGPVYHKLGRRVRYLRKDLRKWAKERRRKSTSDDGTALAAPKAPGPKARPGRDPGTGAAR